MSKVQRLRPRGQIQPVSIPTTASNPTLFEEGYQHGLVSNVLTDFRLSFRLGFRKAKLQQAADRKVQRLQSWDKFSIR